MPLPDDADAVLSALRLGWCVAEVRGRNREPSPGAPAEPTLSVRQIYALPLEMERTAAEQRIQAQTVLWALADKLGVNTDPNDGSKYPERVNSQAERLADLRAKSSDDAVAAWDTLAELLFRFDAHIQDSLMAKSNMQADGYRLGRALAECYWALNPYNMTDWTAWEFLLGPSRCAEMTRLLGRLSGYFKPYTAPAIAGSLLVWKNVADDPRWRMIAYPALPQQVRVWYELTVLGQDATVLIRPYAHLPYSWIISRAMRNFWGPITLVVAGAAGLVTLIVLLGSGAGSSIANILLAILAAVGVSAGGLSAKRFRQDLNTDLTTIAITKAPPPPPGVKSRVASFTRSN